MRNSPGPLVLPNAPMVPHTLVAGSAKLAPLPTAAPCAVPENHWLPTLIPCRIWIGAIWLGVSLLLGALTLAPLVVKFNGWPVREVMMPVTIQPPSTFPAAPWESNALPGPHGS